MRIFKWDNARFELMPLDTSNDDTQELNAVETENTFEETLEAGFGGVTVDNINGTINLTVFNVDNQLASVALTVEQAQELITIIGKAIQEIEGY